ncbi:MAG: uracil-DNA glycosylase family 4 [Planctomycetaceae bacterium]|jgi:uracil-DNA glycosylase family 4
MNPQRILRQKLEDLQRAGVTHVPSELTDFVAALSEQQVAAQAASSATAPASSPPTPSVVAPRTAVASSAPATSSKANPDQPSASQPDKPQAAPAAVTPSVPRKFLPSSAGSLPQEFSPDMTEIKRPCSTAPLDERIAGLSRVAQQVAACARCQELAETRTQTVFGVGNPEADIMYIGEAPGADEDRQGEPFVGKAGQLLDKITEACKLTRQEIYICNILRCRPPGNRNPTPNEAENCREYLDAQIETVDPKYIVCWGSVAAHNLLGTKAAIGKMRGKFFDYKGIKVLCTYHPSYLLRSPGAKKDVWADMKFFRADMGVILD